MRKMMVVLPLVLVLVMLVGCQKPPQADIDAAKASLDGARAAEATDYAPDSLKAAEDSQAQLDAELKVQEQKFALFRSYKKATELSQATKSAGEKASVDAKAKKEQVKGEAQTLITEAKTALDEAKALLEKAPKGKGTQADLEAMKADLMAVETSINEAQNSFNAEKYLDAKSKAEAAKTQAGNVKTSIEQAIEAKKAAKKGKK
jgi:hypothetical protein